MNIHKLIEDELDCKIYNLPSTNHSFLLDLLDVIRSYRYTNPNNSFNPYNDMNFTDYDHDDILYRYIGMDYGY